VTGRTAPFLFCLFAGLGDAATGVLLVAVPALVLRLLGISGDLAADPLLRFVGVFVACVGIAYLYPWVLRGPLRGYRLRTAIEITAGARLAVAAFLAAAVLRATLDAAWIPVGGYDALVAAAQLALLARGFFDGV
jgi:hypothetical protein